MAVIDQTIRAGGLATAALTVYTAPAGATSSSTITSFVVHAEGGRDQLKVHLVNSGDSVTSNNLIYDRAIADGETKFVPIVNQKLKAGDYISVYAVTGNRLNISGSVKEVS
jgi:small-conductance mechanosensitive channel